MNMVLIFSFLKIYQFRSMRKYLQVFICLLIIKFKLGYKWMRNL